ncbi:MAG: CDP-2,3-bis-(O-geranylgeranyl)-sn-glycerol synthase [Candidatus Caldarchaeum sp.]|uniref:CDP-2,3-bis-(O-geranylgeranyl)-sn-glycerol synthase n=1 Tax=Caldiarchaeum subterraneum TaxID=311458 RepID=A0A7C5LEZ6_CALS0
MDLQTFLLGLAYIFPAYVSNATPVVVSKMLKRLHPIDRGYVFVDGRRLFGDGKTFEGFVSGTVAGFAAGLLLSRALPWLLSLPEAFLLAVGALVGDVAGAFVKRRLGLQTGRPAPLLDQLGFLAVAFALVHSTLGLPAWLDPLTVLSLMAFTVFMHVGTNAVAYILRLKDRWY